MRCSFNKYSLTGIFYGLFLSLLFGCSRDDAMDTSPSVGRGQNSLRISTQASGSSAMAESAIRTLRLFVFSADDGSMLLNKHFLTSEAKTVIPTDTYTYFARIGEEYKISELLPKGSIKVLLVANEPISLSGSYTVEKLKGMVIDYYNIYNNSGNLDITIDGSSQISNKGYVPMIAESGDLTLNEWDASAGRIVGMQLVRTLAKATLQIHYDKKDNLFEHPDDKIIITGAALNFVPTYGYLGAIGKPYEAEQVNIAMKNFETPMEIIATANSMATNTLSFYLPEHMLNDVAYQKKRYTYLQVNATFYSGAAQKEYNSTYKIALGDGVSGLASQSDAALLPKESLTVSRNTVYEIKAKVTTHGKLDIFQVEVGVAPWDKIEEVNGDIDAPVLNITSTEVQMSQHVVRVHFWSNQSSLFISGTGSRDGISFDVNDVFKDLTSTDNTGNFHLYAESDEEYKAYNGYMDIEFKEEAIYNQDHSYLLTMNAGRLKRTITVTSNPQVGEIIFEPNGGTGSYTYPVKYAELNGKHIIEAEISLPDPVARFTAPAGQAFMMWVYSNGESNVEVTNGNCVVKPAGYTTKINALWNN